MIRRALLVEGATEPTQRIEQLAESLELADWSVGLRLLRDPGWPEAVEPHSVVLLHNVSTSAELDRGMAAARSVGALVVGDLSNWTGRVDSPSATGVADQSGVPHGTGYDADSVSRAYASFDMCLAANEALAARLSTWGAAGAIVSPALTLTSWRTCGLAYRSRMRRVAIFEEPSISAGAASARPEPRELERSEPLAATWAIRPEVVVGVVAADRGFRALGDIGSSLVLQLLQADDRCGALVVGAEDPGQWPSAGGRIGHVALPEFSLLPMIISECDMLVTARGSGDQESEADCEWSTIMGAAAGIPVVASPTAPLAGLVTDGLTGVLAGDDQGIVGAVRDLANDRDKRYRMGIAARDTISRRHVTDVTFRELVTYLVQLTEGEADRRSETFTLAIGQATVEENLLGGNLVTELTRRGHAAEVVADDAWDKRDAPTTGVTIAIGAAAGAEMAGRSASPYKLVAVDDGALMHPMGPELVSAEAAHAGAAHTAALGPWLSHGLARKYGVPTDLVRYPLDNRLFTPGRCSRPPTIALNVAWMESPPDRDMGLQALAKLASTVDGVTLALYGAEQDPLAGIAAPLPYQWLGAISDEDRARLFASVSALLYTGLTNVPLDVVEAMAADCPVVAIAGDASNWLLIDGQTAVLASPRPDALAAALGAVIVDDALRMRVTDGALNAVERQGIGQSTLDLAHWAVCTALGDCRVSPALELDVLRQDDGGNGRGGTGPIGLPFECSGPGLCRLDLQLDLKNAAPDEELELNIHADSEHGPVLRSSRVQVSSAPDQYWVPFRFEPIPDSAGKWFFAQLSDVSATGEKVPASWDAAGTSSRERSTVDGRRDRGTMAFRTFRRRSCPGSGAFDAGERADAQIGPDPALAPFLNTLAALDREVHELWTDLEADRRTLPYRLAHIGDTLLSPLPPISERPWPPNASARVKLWGTLRHYGPIALVRELASYARWATMSDRARQSAVRADD